MTRFARLATGTAFSAALAAGAFAATPASADTTRTNCMGNNCVRVHCDNTTGRCTETTNFPVAREHTYWRYWQERPAFATQYQQIRTEKPKRYVCDLEGYNCHWTRSYYIDSYGEPIYDPGMAQ